MTSPEQINLRGATNPQMSCASCGNGVPAPDGSIMCQVLGVPVKPEHVSDAYVPLGQGQQAAAPPAGPSPDMMAQLFGGGQ